MGPLKFDHWKRVIHVLWNREIPLLKKQSINFQWFSPILIFVSGGCASFMHERQFETNREAINIGSAFQPPWVWPWCQVSLWFPPSVLHQDPILLHQGLEGSWEKGAVLELHPRFLPWCSCSFLIGVTEEASQPSVVQFWSNSSVCDCVKRCLTQGLGHSPPKKAVTAREISPYSFS